MFRNSHFLPFFFCPSAASLIHTQKTLFYYCLSAHKRALRLSVFVSKQPLATDKNKRRHYMKRRLSGGKKEEKRADVRNDERHWQLLLSQLLSPPTAPAQRQRGGMLLLGRARRFRSTRSRPGGPDVPPIPHTGAPIWPPVSPRARQATDFP